MKRFGIIFYLLFTTIINTKAQVPDIKRISGLPTREVYDLMVDSKGFLWIAHDLGISRYDGINFTSYTYAGQTSISATDLVEDEYGRIWFHNFTGQILYIENGKMHLLAAYEYLKETSFPRIVLYQHKLFASTNKGLFACDLKTLKSKYILLADSPHGTASLTVIKNTLIAYGSGNWYKYTGRGALTPISLVGDSTSFIRSNSSTLTATAFRDTAYLLSNPAAVVCHITLEGDHLRLIKKTHAANFVNTVTVTSKNVWINSTKTSFISGSPNEQIKEHNLTDMVTDHEGNTWYSSLNHGLLVKYKLLTSEPVPLQFSPDDRVKCIEKFGPLLLFGTHSSKIILYDTEQAKVIKQITLPGTPGVISAIYRLDHHTKFLVGANVSTYEVDIETGSVKLFSSVKTLKQVAKTARFTMIASAGGLSVRPEQSTDLTDIGRLFKGLTLRHDDGDYYALPIRCRAICYDIIKQQIFVAFKDGLYTINKAGMQPYYYNNAIVHPASLQYIDGKVIVGTINDGLLIIDGDKTLHLTTDNGLSSNTIYKIKHIGNQIWLLGGGLPRLVDLTTQKIVTDLNLSALNEVQVLDVAKGGDKTFITTPDGLFWLTISKSVEKFTINNYLQTVMVNNRPLAFNAPHHFTYNENNIAFNLEVPFYYGAHDIFFKYLLKGTSNKIWQATKPGERTITFSELSPGSYTLIAYAVHPELGTAKKPFTYSFLITPKWWELWWFRALFILGVAGLVAYIAASYFLNRLSLQKALYEQQLGIQNERERISSEMHDDVGAGLSAMKLFINMAKNENTQPLDYVQMSSMLSDMTQKINEIIWSNNIKNDTLESLLYYIEYQSAKLFTHAGLTFESRVPTEIPYYEINGEKRRNIDLVTREFLHNALKHSGATIVSLDILIEHADLKLVIKDNGKGFNPLTAVTRGMGMKTTKTRVQQLKGKLDIKSDQQGTTVTLIIPFV